MRTLRATLIATLLLLPLGCGETTEDVLLLAGEAPWAEGVGELLIESIVDERGDYDGLAYPPLDLTELSFGTAGGYLYLRVDLAAPIPAGPVPLSRDGEIEAQLIHEQAFLLQVETDGDEQTGAEEGVDIVFAITIEYGKPIDIQARFDFVEGDVTRYRGYVDGEFGGGGPGKAHVIVRYDTSSIPVAFWPFGSTVELRGRSTARSDLYDSVSRDLLTPAKWKLPPLE